MEVWFYCHVRYLKGNYQGIVSSDEWVTVYRDGTTNVFQVFKPVNSRDNFLYGTMYGIVFREYRIVEFSSSPYTSLQSGVKNLLISYLKLREAIAAEQIKRRSLYECQ